MIKSKQHVQMTVNATSVICKQVANVAGRYEVQASAWLVQPPAKETAKLKLRQNAAASLKMYTKDVSLKRLLQGYTSLYSSGEFLIRTESRQGGKVAH